MDLQNEISRVAYEIFVERGCLLGHDMENWLDAEKIVQSRQISDLEREKMTVKEQSTTAPEPLNDPASC